MLLSQIITELKDSVYVPGDSSRQFVIERNDQSKTDKAVERKSLVGCFIKTLDTPSISAEYRSQYGVVEHVSKDKSKLTVCFASGETESVPRDAAAIIRGNRSSTVNQKMGSTLLFPKAKQVEVESLATTSGT